MTKTTKNNFITCGITLGLFVIFGILSFAGVLGSQYSGLLVPIGIYIILSISLNLTVGILGELSLGHAGFMCVGAYAGGIFSLLTQESINPSWLRMILALIVGGLAAAAFGVLIGIPVLRLRGDYLAIVTLGSARSSRRLPTTSISHWTSTDCTSALLPLSVGLTQKPAKLSWRAQRV